MDNIQFEIQDKIATLTIQRPEALNALNQKTLDELHMVLDKLEKEKDLRCIIVTGAGDKAFVAGADIKEMENLSSEHAQEFANKGQRAFRRFEVLECPVIAAVNGFALGGGLELALSCDFIYASENAVFGLPEVSLGLMPGFGGTQRLSRFVGLAKAKELTYTAAKINAQEALQLSLVNKVVAKENLMDEVRACAKKIASLAPIAISASKGAIQQGYDLAIDPGMHLERSLFGELFRSKDMKIGVKAFINKEKPTFIGE